MKFRIARHTNNLAPIINFYQNLLGLSILGDFNNHDGYDGIFLGLPHADWHLEFTVSHQPPIHQPDDDDLFGFYLPTAIEYKLLNEKFSANNVMKAEAKNPYWEANGATYIDPDGYRIVLTIDK